VAGLKREKIGIMTIATVNGARFGYGNLVAAQNPCYLCTDGLAGEKCDRVPRAFYCAAQHFSSGTLTAIALPLNEPHRKCVEKTQ
jgi:hypothetical protein